MAAAVIRVTSHHTNTDDGSTTDVAGTTLFFKQADTDTSGGSVPHNGAGTNYSWIKQLRLYVNGAPNNLVNNLKAYWSGTAVANIAVNGLTASAYIDPTTNFNAVVMPGTTSMYTYTAIAPLSLSGSFTVGTDVAPKFIGDWLRLQLAVGNAALLSPTPLGSLIYRYDEQ